MYFNDEINLDICTFLELFFQFKLSIFFYLQDLNLIRF